MSSLRNVVVLTSTARALATNGVAVGGSQSARDQQSSQPARTRVWVLFAGVHIGLCGVMARSRRGGAGGHTVQID